MSGPWDLFIEHGHRLLGSLAGLLTIALNVAVWRYDSRGWLRSFAVLALVLVISQGVLGGMRVRLNSTDLARVHGCTGPLFFAVAVAMSVFTSGFWKQFPEFDYSSLQRSKKVAGGSWLLVAVAYAQWVLGAHLRHPNVSWTPGQFRVFVVFHLGPLVDTALPL